MGMMGMFKWLRKDIIQRERNGWNLSPKQCSLNNESYRNALQAFIDRRRFSDDASVEAASPSGPDKKSPDYFSKNTNSRNNNNNNRHEKDWKSRDSKSVVPGVPHIRASEIFEIGWVAGTEDRYLELIFAEWQNTRVSLKRHTHPECKDALREDLEVLTEIRHPNILLLMATTQTEDHGLVSIFESIDCTLYSYIHDQGERISIQGIAKCGGKLADALRHSHMRGYVHGAISSHCVYLASSGTIKLGGWELAIRIKSPNVEREYEERLRTEIYRWQAPEVFTGCEPSKESDVYGLALLIWEMCTMQVPWTGFSKADVERQYAHWKRGVIMDLYNFSPLLNNLLEAGLQLDINKRTLDMNRMRRFLQRLEMQHEDEDPIYVEQYSNNNDENANTFLISTERTHTTTSGITRSKLPKQLFFSTAEAHRFASPKGDSNLQRVNIFDDSEGENSKANSSDAQHKSASALPNLRKKNEANSLSAKHNFDDPAHHPWNSTYRKVKLSKQTLESEQISIVPNSARLTDLTDNETIKDAQATIKKLKEVIASRRERFFFGNDAPMQATHISAPRTSPKAKSKVLIQVRSKDYEPHKPASHKTSLEPKYCKSPGEYDPSTFIKFPCAQCRVRYSHCQYTHEPVYLHAAGGIKTGSIIPQVLNADQDFFESSLWRKEKLICISKMRKSGQEDETTGEESQGQINSETSKNACPRFESTRSDATYVIDGKTSADNTKATDSDNSHVCQTEETFDSKESSNAQNGPLQVLKNALDRATEIICAKDEECSPPSLKSFETFDNTADSETQKFIFEEIYDLKSTDNEEIKSIERSDADNNTFLLSAKDSSTENESSKDQRETDGSVKNREKSDESSLDSGRQRNFVCESIAEISNESNVSQEEKIDDACAAISGYFARKNEEASCAKSKNAVQDSSEISLENRESNASNYPFMLLNDQSRDKGCRSCYKHALPRRRSLPAALGHLKGINHSSLGKLPIRKGGVPDNTVEDLYIDDEFGDSLNVNMVLQDEDVSLDEDFLPDISEFEHP